VAVVRQVPRRGPPAPPDRAVKPLLQAAGGRCNAVACRERLLESLQSAGSDEIADPLADLRLSLRLRADRLRPAYRRDRRRRADDAGAAPLPAADRLDRAGIRHRLRAVPAAG